MINTPLCLRRPLPLPQHPPHDNMFMLLNFLGSAEYGVPPYKNKAAIFVSLLSGNVLRKLSENVWVAPGRLAPCNPPSVRVQRCSLTEDMSEKSKIGKCVFFSFPFFFAFIWKFKATCTYFQDFTVRQKGWMFKAEQLCLCVKLYYRGTLFLGDVYLLDLCEV